MDFDYDLIVVGSGAGGGTFAQACARAGKAVLLLERGRKPELSNGSHNERHTLIEKRPYDDRNIIVNRLVRRPYIGGVLGGGTSLFGAALLRPSREDFHPGRSYGDRIPRAIWDWPIGYDDLELHYDAAERLYGVAGNRDEDFGPLQKPRQAYPRSSLPLHPINRKLIAANRARGLQPFRLPLAIDPAHCLNCGFCAGYVCPTGARASSSQLLSHAQAAGWPLVIRTNAEAEQLVLEGNGQVAGIRYLDRTSAKRTIARARRYVLAAGAIFSPLLLLRSGIKNSLIGRYYMYHLSPVVAGVFTNTSGAAEAFVKQVGFADYYLGTKAFSHKMGLVQSLPVPGPLLLAKMAPLVPRSFLGALRRRLLPLAGIVEDLPNPANQVDWNDDLRPRVRHRFSPYDLERGRHLSRSMARILTRGGARFCISQQCTPYDHLAHQCGTLRFGKDSRSAALDPDCRLFGYPNTFVVDGSFLPTSLGVGPALTIIANALRVAAVVIREL
jgi:choline dehydrogenase-like flavoprotein